MNKYSDKAENKIHEVMKEYKAGTLRSGRSNKKVTDKDQAIAIGINEARKRGYKTPKDK
jgi:hypothetical protein